MAKKQLPPTAIPALSVRQWLPGWSDFRFDPKDQQRRPEPGFLLCSMKAGHLKALTGVYRRSVAGGKQRALDQNVQRGHEEERSEKIREFIRYGFPWCEMGEGKRRQPGAELDKKPGWIPTAILVNILPPGAERNGTKIQATDLITVQPAGAAATLNLPKGFDTSWTPKSIFPLEVIDGQHRLWAFQGFDPGDDFELPVVAFYGLDHGWQAYLFWSVNITPKRINRSLAFDLYPLLRHQTWLDRFAGHSIYRETRCQELVEALWSNSESPWHQRINMLGEKREFREYKGPAVSQAAFIRSLQASFVKRWEDGAEKIGGLFGAPAQQHDPRLPWNRAMQAAFLITCAGLLHSSVRESKKPWAESLRKAGSSGLSKDDDAAFYGEYSLLATDQGIRGFLFAVNDLCFVEAEDLDLAGWRWDLVYESKDSAQLAATESGAVAAALKTLSRRKTVVEFLKGIASGLASYDWRTSSAPDLNPEEQRGRLVFRGSSGYRELRRQLVEHLAAQKGAVATAAKKVAVQLGHK